MTTISTYLWPGQVHFGFDAARLVGQEAQALGAKKVFVVADPGVIAAGLLEPVIASLKNVFLPHVVFDKVMPNPDFESVEVGVKRYGESEVDLIVAVGGGSGLDTAKAIRLVAEGGGHISEYDIFLGDKVRPVPRQMPPFIAIPTTAGTGSEVTAWAVVTDLARKLKTAVGDAPLMPTVALIDPELMLTLPPYLTAGTGMDALSHCIETYVSTTDHPALDPMILNGIELIGRSLREAVGQGANRAARRDMALAAMIGGMALNSKWGGACHSLAHQLSTFADVHHGVANSLMLPHQMRYSAIGALEKYAYIAEALGASREGTLRQRAFRAADVVRELAEDIGLPTRLRDAGVTEGMIPEMAKNAYIDISWETNPREVSVEVMEQLFRQAY